MSSEEKEGESKQREGIEDFRKDDFDWSFYKAIKQRQKARRDEYRIRKKGSQKDE